MREEMYYQGDLVDSTVTFHDNGKIDVINNYSEDYRHGFTTRTAPDGQLMYKIYYEYGTVVYYTYQGADGNLVPPIYFKNGSGNMKSFYKNGKPSADILYEASLVNGQLNLFYPDGKPMKTEQDKFGETEGQYIFYHPNGKKAIEGNYLNGDQHGSYIRTNEDGSPMLEEQYVKGTLHGVSKYYDKGKLTHVVTYYHGAVVKIEKK